MGVTPSPLGRMPTFENQEGDGNRAGVIVVASRVRFAAVSIGMIAELRCADCNEVGDPGFAKAVNPWIAGRRNRVGGPVDQKYAVGGHAGLERDLGFQDGAVTQLSQRLEQRFPVGAEEAGVVDRRQRLLLMEDATQARL